MRDQQADCLRAAIRFVADIYQQERDDENDLKLHGYMLRKLEEIAKKLAQAKEGRDD
jgi:hypothetical protein